MGTHARVLIHVRDEEMNPEEEAVVEVRPEGASQWRRANYDRRLERYSSGKLPPDTLCRIRVRSTKRTAQEARSKRLQPGDNPVFITVAPRGTPFYTAADKEKVYFQSDDRKLLLYVRGKGARERSPALLRKSGVHSFKPVELPDGTQPENEAKFLVDLSESPSSRVSQTTALRAAARDTLPSQGFSARIAAPMYRGKNVTEGLTSELIVRFEPSIDAFAARRLARAMGFEVVRDIPYLDNGYLWRRDGLPGYGILETARELMKNHPVVYAEPNVVFTLEMDGCFPREFLYPEQPHYQVIDAEGAWNALAKIDADRRAGLPDVSMAVLDAQGVAPDHPDLAGTLTDGRARMAANFDFLNMRRQRAADLAGDHGTKCASSAAGLAGNCRLIAAQLPNDLTGLEMTDAWIWAAGFETGSADPCFPDVPSPGADVISNAWGVTGGALTNAVKDTLDFLTTFGRKGRGCVVCFSAGNLGYVSFSPWRRYAAYGRTIAVGASISANPTNPCTSGDPDPKGSVTRLPAVLDTRAYYSPYGPELDIVAPSHTCYDLIWEEVDPVAAAVRPGQGDRIGEASASTTTSASLRPGDTMIPVEDTDGFYDGGMVMIGAPGAANREFKRILSVGDGRLGVEGLEYFHPMATEISTGPDDYSRSFGGTSHACATAAGAAALVLSANPELTGAQAREILRMSAERVDVQQEHPQGQWRDDGDGAEKFSQWYGCGRLNMAGAIAQVRALLRAASTLQESPRALRPGSSTELRQGGSWRCTSSF